MDASAVYVDVLSGMVAVVAGDDVERACVDGDVRRRVAELAADERNVDLEVPASELDGVVRLEGGDLSRIVRRRHLGRDVRRQVELTALDIDVPTVDELALRTLELDLALAALEVRLAALLEADGLALRSGDLGVERSVLKSERRVRVVEVDSDELVGAVLLRGLHLDLSAGLKVVALEVDARGVVLVVVELDFDVPARDRKVAASEDALSAVEVLFVREI